ncbi:MAG: NYN domain-containing protein, partial [Mesorhizobium sp.]
RGRKVSIISTMASQPPMISDDLRRQADHFIDLMTLKSEVGRDPSERPVRRPEPAEVDEDDY